MIDKLNIKIHNKLTKKIEYNLWLDEDFWRKDEYDDRGKEIYYEDDTGYWEKREYDTRGNEIYYENSGGNWYKREYNSVGNIIYHENSDGYIRDDRKIKH